MLVLLSFGMTILSLAGAYYTRSEFWQSVGISAASAFMALGFGLLFVNLYLEKSARRGAVLSLLLLSYKPFEAFHDRFLDLVWAKFGKDEWEKIFTSFHEGDGPEVLREDVRMFFHALGTSNKEMRAHLERLLDTLAEVSRLVGWDLDPGLLEACLDSRNAFTDLKEVGEEASEENINIATAQLLNGHFYSRQALHRMMEIAGITDN